MFTLTPPTFGPGTRSAKIRGPIGAGPPNEPAYTTAAPPAPPRIPDPPDVRRERTRTRIRRHAGRADLARLHAACERRLLRRLHGARHPLPRDPVLRRLRFRAGSSSSLPISSPGAASGSGSPSSSRATSESPSRSSSGSRASSGSGSGSAGGGGATGTNPYNNPSLYAQPPQPPPPTTGTTGKPPGSGSGHQPSGGGGKTH
jgi:hypothetical protein